MSSEKSDGNAALKGPGLATRLLMSAGFVVVIGGIVAGSVWGIAAVQSGNDKMYSLENHGASGNDASAPTFVALTPAEQGPAGSAEHGKELFNMSCVACHGPTGNGVPLLGANLRKSKYIATHTNSDMVAMIKRGRLPDDSDTVMHGIMPPKGANPGLDDAGALDVVTFLRTLQVDAGVAKAAPAAAPATK